MIIAKIIRHRHKKMYYINDDLKAVDEEVHYKLVFSHPGFLKGFMQWCEELGGKYEYDKSTNVQNGLIPRVEEFDGESVCWCDIMSFYLVHVIGFKFHSTISPYKGEVFTYERMSNMLPGTEGVK